MSLVNLNAIIPINIFNLFLKGELSGNAYKVVHLFLVEMGKNLEKNKESKYIKLTYNQMAIKLKTGASTIIRGVEELIAKNIIEKNSKHGRSNEYYFTANYVPNLSGQNADKEDNFEENNFEENNFKEHNSKKNKVPEIMVETEEERKIVEYLTEHKLNKQTILNILVIENITLEKVKKGVFYTLGRGYGAGALVNCLREGWTTSFDRMFKGFEKVKREVDPEELEEKRQFFKYFGGLSREEKELALTISEGISIETLTKEKSRLRTMTPREFINHLRTLERKSYSST